MKNIVPIHQRLSIGAIKRFQFNIHPSANHLDGLRSCELHSTALIQTEDYSPHPMLESLRQWFVAD